jgi:two-component system, NtrC family, sensor kinase
MNARGQPPSSGTRTDSPASAKRGGAERSHLGAMRRRLLVGFLLSYFIPLAVLNVYFHIQFSGTLIESGKLHLTTIAGSQRNTVDLFLQERVFDLIHLSQDRSDDRIPSGAEFEAYLEGLQSASPAFEDVSFLDSSGKQVGYAGPYSQLLGDEYGDEPWFQELLQGDQDYHITNIYLGHRLKPHLTVAVKKIMGEETYVLRATLDPERFYVLLRSLSRHGGVDFSLVNRKGEYQAVGSEEGELLGVSSFLPDADRSSGAEEITVGDEDVLVAWSWLQNVPWVLTVQQPLGSAYSAMYRTRWVVLGSTAALMLVILALAWLTSDRLLRQAEEGERVEHELRSQLIHAAKLASVGELAAGIAHEINNPLAIIGAQSGLIGDMLDPVYEMDDSPDALRAELGHIDDAVGRAKIITGQLLDYARKRPPSLTSCSMNEILEQVVSGIKEEEFRVNNIELVRAFDEELPDIRVDRDQLRQVFLNLVNNAQDAIGSGGTITLTTRRVGERVRVSVRDTGRGMSPEEMERIFQPFFTTKEVGKGTGLGLSVSLGIIEGMDGRFQVQSLLNSGSEFTVSLPVGIGSEVDDERR